jgi:hypothetical protein
MMVKGANTNRYTGIPVAMPLSLIPLELRVFPPVAEMRGRPVRIRFGKSRRNGIYFRRALTATFATSSQLLRLTAIPT